MKKITITFTESELQALVDLVDAGVKSLGLRGVNTASVIISKLNTATVSEDEKTEDKE